MNILHSIGLKDFGSFKEVKFDIPLGISVIYGLNRAGGRSSKNSNGVGKSLLFSSLSEILYDEPIVGEKSDRMKSGTRSVEFTNAHGKKILISRQMRGKSEKIQAVQDGVDQELRKLPVAKAFMKSAWPLSVDDYNTYVHIDSRIPHPLVMGSSAERKRFFTNFFNLNKLDAERKLYSAELSRLSKIRAAFAELRAQYLKGKRDLLEPEQVTELETKLATLRKTIRTLQDRFAKVQDTIRLVQFGKSAKDQIVTLGTALGGTITEEEFAKAKADNKWETEKIEKDLQDAEEWEQYKRDNKAYIEGYNGLSDEAKAAIKQFGLRDARVNSQGAQRELMRAREDVKRIKSDIRAIDDEMPELPKRVEAPAEEEEELRTLKRVYEHHLEHAEKFEDGKCETCGQPVKIKDPALVRKKLDAINIKLKAHAAAKAYATTKKERVALEFKARAYTKNLERAREKVQQFVKEASYADELRDLPRKPKPFTGKKLQVVVLKRMLEELTERRQLLKYLEPHLDTVIAFTQLTESDLKKVADSEEVQDRMGRIQDRLSVTQAKLEVHKTVSGRLAEMRTRLREMKADLNEEAAIKHLVAGYQDKNIKKMAVEAISERLMALVNRYAKAVFVEDFRFEFEWGTQISLLVHRKYGKRVDTSDVRKLSGAESVFFTLILVCALLNFVPASKRCSVLILDEPSARMSKEMTDTLQGLLKTLNTMIPSIVVITPKSDEMYEGAKNYTVIKESGVAKIVEGMPHQVKTK